VIYRARTINMPKHLELAWDRLKATYPDQSFGGLVNRLLTQYFLKTGFLFEEEIPVKQPYRPLKMGGDTSRFKNTT
jgi:hypothetical protein